MKYMNSFLDITFEKYRYCVYSNGTIYDEREGEEVLGNYYDPISKTIVKNIVFHIIELYDINGTVHRLKRKDVVYNTLINKIESDEEVYLIKKENNKFVTGNYDISNLAIKKKDETIKYKFNSTSNVLTSTDTKILNYIKDNILILDDMGLVNRVNLKFQSNISLNDIKDIKNGKQHVAFFEDIKNWMIKEERKKNYQNKWNHCMINI